MTSCQSWNFSNSGFCLSCDLKVCTVLVSATQTLLKRLLSICAKYAARRHVSHLKLPRLAFMSATRSQHSAKLFHFRGTVFRVTGMSQELKAQEQRGVGVSGAGGTGEAAHITVFLFWIPNISLAFFPPPPKNSKKFESPRIFCCWIF